MKDISRLEGIWPVMPTPFMESGAVDIACVKALADWYARSLCHGILVSGSGGEFPYIMPEERVAMIYAALEGSEGRAPIMAGLGPMGTPEAVRQAKDAVKVGASFVLVALPTYYPITLSRAIDHYKAIADATDGRVLYYHFPQVTGFDPGPEGIAKICDIDGIVGAKMSRPNLKEMKKVLEAIKKRPFALFSGTALILKETLDLGGCGAIGILPSVFPGESVEWYTSLLSNYREGIKRSSPKIKAAINLLVGFGAPPIVQRLALRIISKLPFTISAGDTPHHAAIKEAIRLRGLPIRSDVRCPLPTLNDETQRRVFKLMKKLKMVAEAKE